MHIPLYICIYIQRICILFQILFHYILFQDIEYCSLGYSVSPCCLSILYIAVCSWASLGLAGKESICSAGDPDSIPGSGDRLPTPAFLGFPGGLDCKEST